MRMERNRQKSETKWYQPLPQRNWRDNIMPRISRPSSRISSIGSLQKSLQEADWVSLTGTRASSGTSNNFDSPTSNTKFRQSRTRKQNKIEEILTKHPAPRPRSVSLVKYEPLPAINSGSPRRMRDSSTSRYDKGASKPLGYANRASSVGALENKLYDTPTFILDEESAEFCNSSCESDTATAESEMRDEAEETPTVVTVADEITKPKLIRSQTFDVIESNLTNLPVIEDYSLESSTEGDVLQERVKITVDGVPLLKFIGQIDLSRPSSHSSLITHPGTPDSGFAGLSTTSSGMSNYPVSGNFFIQDSGNFDSVDLGDEEANDDNNVFIILPDETRQESAVNLKTTLSEFLDYLSRVDESRRFVLVDKVHDKHKNQTLNKLGFSDIETVQLVLDA